MACGAAVVATRVGALTDIAGEGIEFVAVGDVDDQARAITRLAADAALADVEVRKDTLERRVALLRPQNLDRDMLEERAHVMLGAVEGDDLIVPDPKTARPARD